MVLSHPPLYLLWFVPFLLVPHGLLLPSAMLPHLRIVFCNYVCSKLLCTTRGDLSISDCLYKIKSVADNFALFGSPFNW